MTVNYPTNRSLDSKISRIGQDKMNIAASPQAGHTLRWEACLQKDISSRRANTEQTTNTLQFSISANISNLKIASYTSNRHRTPNMVHRDIALDITQVSVTAYITRSYRRCAS